jgi:flagellar biosynthesis/type III secretory pathway M-ring protein FliF/YscJ
MEQFQETLDSFLEENPSPDFSALEEAFGSPEQMARELMENVPPHEIDQWKRAQKIKKIVAGALVCGLAVACIFVFFYKENNTVQVTERIFLYESKEEYEAGLIHDEDTSNDIETDNGGQNETSSQ